jgi:uncharacterized membrane protein
MERLRDLLRNVRDSFWFVPSVALVGGVLLAVGLVEVDVRVNARLAADWPRLFGVGAEGARGTLAAIAGSMITVAGVVFSVTIVALSLAASAYSPRVLRNFMHDRPTQITFGVFVAVFVYCLVALRTVRAADGGDPEFVPSLAVLGALVLAVLAVWVLVYFIHHVAVIIQVSTILERIATETAGAIDRLFPEELGESVEDAAEEFVPAPVRVWRALPARRTGYVVAVDADALAEFARHRGAVLRMDLGVGEFAIASQPLASLAGGDGDPAEDARALDRLYSIAAERSIDQDAGFGIQQIVDIAARALSPGINDPGTATMCIDHLTALLVRLARRRTPSRLRAAEGRLHVIAKGASFENLAEAAFEPLARYAAGKIEVLTNLERAARTIERAAPPPRRLVMRPCLDAIERARRSAARTG